MNYSTIPLGPFETNCHLIWEKEDQCVIVDPSSQPELILDRLETNNLMPVAILLTHGHFDHISAMPALLEEYSIPVYLHKKDQNWAFTKENICPPFFNDVVSKPQDLFELKEDVQPKSIPFPVTIIETPGHTPGGICIYLPIAGLLFTGDTLFCGGIGRTDINGGNMQQLTESLERLRELPGNTRVFPGHGSATTIAREKQSNYYFQ